MVNRLKFHLIFSVTLILCCNNQQPELQRSNSTLRERINKLIASSDAKIGVALVEIESGDTFSVNNAQRYPMQSVYKFPIAMAVLDQVDKGKISPDQKVYLSKKAAAEETWSPLTDMYPKGNVEVSVEDLLRYMVSFSDNVACDMLFELLGGPAKVNSYLQSLGARDIQVLSTEKEMHRKTALMYENYSTPLAMSQLLQGFFRGNYLSEKSTALLMKLMIESANNPRIGALLGPEVEVAHKTGTSGLDKKNVRGACNDVAIIKMPDGKHIALTVFVMDTKAGLQETEKLIGLISLAIYEHYSGRSYTYFRKAIQVAGSDTLPYRLLSPANEDPSQKYPLLVYLHGAGNRGRDNEKPLSKLHSSFTDSAHRLKYPCYVLLPQCPQSSAWAIFPDYPKSLRATDAPSKPADLCLQLIRKLIAEQNIDPKRIYLTGFSLGAEGTFDLAIREPGLFACAVPLAGLGDTSKASLLKDMPLWAFHGSDDQVIEMKYSQFMIDAIKRAGGNPNYTVLPGMQHQIQPEVYSKPELWKWIFDQRKK